MIQILFSPLLMIQILSYPLHNSHIAQSTLLMIQILSNPLLMFQILSYPLSTISDFVQSPLNDLDFVRSALNNSDLVLFTLRNSDFVQSTPNDSDFVLIGIKCVLKTDPNCSHSKTSLTW